MLLRLLTAIAGIAALSGALLAGPAAPPATAAHATSAVPTTGAVPTSADAIDRCLARSAIVPVEADAASTAPIAREAALRTLQHALLAAAPDGLAAADLRFGADGPVGVDVVEHVEGALGAALPAALDGLPPALGPFVDAADVAVVGSAPHALRALCAGLDAVLQTDADAIVSAGIDHRRATLRLGIDVPRAAAAAVDDIRSLPSAVDGEAPVAASPPLLADLGLALPDVPVDVVADAADTPASRIDDRDGVGGGTALRVEGLACTAGFSVRAADGASALMSAGHCPDPDGEQGAPVANGFGALGCAMGAGRALGRVSDNQLATMAFTDTMLVRTPEARPTMWLGARCTGSREVAVHGAAVVGPGATVGFSGARSGEQTATRTSEPAQCYDFGYWACGVLRAMTPSATYACHAGDSGGPAFRADGAGVLALGIISASGYDLGINRCSWTDMAVALQHSRATLMVDAPSTMAPPSRIAGADRFETSAAISRSGYPTGASTVYVASGERFPDALSAGAAAAHQRAPLLLTAQSSISHHVWWEIVRLRPERIIVVGGEPSISARLAADLGSIAPVERIGGADRFETSARIAQHAFPGGAASAFLATGREFPDALAAGPVAALRDAPVLLVDDRPAAPSAVVTADALTALGVRDATIVGGPSSVSTELERSLASTIAVRRIAGADRFATAALLGASFAARPPALYVASGQDFPDALSASAIAGARGAPLYLTRPWCLAPAIRDAHERLGRPPVVLLGGTPTLSAAVERYEPCG